MNTKVNFRKQIKVLVDVEVLYFNCRECGSPLNVIDQHESGWCGCGSETPEPETEQQRKARLLSRGKPFSAKREFVIATLRKFFEEHKQAPTLRQMGSMLGVSPDAAREYLRHLEDSGDVVRTKRTARGFVLKGCEHLIEVKPKVRAPRAPYQRIMSKETLQKRIDRVVEEARRREADGVQIFRQSDLYVPIPRGGCKVG